MLKMINNQWVYQEPLKHPKCIQRINEHLEFLSKHCIVESNESGAYFYCEKQSPYWSYTNLITD
jgi:hypothetical protein